MAEEPPGRVLSFISEHQLEEFREKRGDRVEDGSIQRDRALFEILKENKDKQQAEFNERFKHRPPKALDEDETEFLERVEMSKRELEKQWESEEARQLQSFKAAVASHTMNTVFSKEPTKQNSEDSTSKVSEKKAAQARRPIGPFITVKPQAKKLKTSSDDAQIIVENVKETKQTNSEEKSNTVDPSNNPILGLVSYSDESEDEAE